MNAMRFAKLAVPMALAVFTFLFLPRFARRRLQAGEGSAASACFRGQAARTAAAAPATHDDPWHLEAQPR